MESSASEPGLSYKMRPYYKMPQSRGYFTRIWLREVNSFLESA